MRHPPARFSTPGRKLLLLGASWLFYATWSPRFLALLIATAWADSHLARWIHVVRGRPARARALLLASVTMNLGTLAFFKYGRFLCQSAGALVAMPPIPAVTVPLGISFYTFHSISYVMDTYRGVRPPTDRFADFALYVASSPSWWWDRSPAGGSSGRS